MPKRNYKFEKRQKDLAKKKKKEEKMKRKLERKQAAQGGDNSVDSQEENPESD